MSENFMLFSTPEGAEECERRTREVGGGREPSIPFFPQIAKYIKKKSVLLMIIGR